MKRETIGVHALVSTTLTSFGAHVLAEYLDAEMERATGLAIPKRDGPRVQTTREVEMPLWELLKIFGRTMVSSARLPFEELEFLRHDSKDETECRIAKQSRIDVLADLLELAKAIGIGDPFKAPEIITVLARQYAAHVPPRVPSRPGYWWIDGDVVMVTEKDGKLSARVDGRRRPVSDDQPWQGPAILDARVRQAGSETDDDQDIPF
jgi:hypothetical protein